MHRAAGVYGKHKGRPREERLRTCLREDRRVGGQSACQQNEAASSGPRTRSDALLVEQPLLSWHPVHRHTFPRKASKHPSVKQLICLSWTSEFKWMATERAAAASAATASGAVMARAAEA